MLPRSGEKQIREKSMKDEDGANGYVTKLDDTYYDTDNFDVKLYYSDVNEINADYQRWSRPRCGGHSNDLAERASHHTDGERVGLKRPDGP